MRLRAQTEPPRWQARVFVACVLLAAFLGRHHQLSLFPTAAVEAGPSEPIPYTTHYYFGGQPLRGAGTPLQLGAGSTGFWSSFLPSAAPPAGQVSCLAAPPPALVNRSPKNIAADLPGLYGAPWVASVNGGLIAALNVVVPRNPSWQPAGPVLQIYRHGARQPEFSQTVPVSVTRGSSALLYRMFINGPIRCIDLVIPNGAGAGTAYLYYPFRGRLFEAEGHFAIQR